MLAKKSLNKIPEEKTIVLMTVVSKEVAERIKSWESDNVLVIDLLYRTLSLIEEFTGVEATREPGLIRVLDNDYFERSRQLNLP